MINQKRYEIEIGVMVTIAIQLPVKNARNVEFVNNFLWVAHNLEGAGDRAINICERTIYVETDELDMSAASTDDF